jgi:hypothetical protein
MGKRQWLRAGGAVKNLSYLLDVEFGSAHQLLDVGLGEAHEVSVMA